MFKRRWYDRSEKTQTALSLLKDLDEKSREIISRDIIHISNSIKEVRKEEEALPLSLGIKRVLGLYQTTNARRWYDNNELDNAFRTIATLPDEDFENIMEGLCVSLNG